MITLKEIKLSLLRRIKVCRVIEEIRFIEDEMSIHYSQEEITKKTAVKRKEIEAAANKRAGKVKFDFTRTV